MEFAEVRGVHPGRRGPHDSDWERHRSHGRSYVKKFVEERDLTLLLLVDVSGSQQFGRSTS